MNTPTPVDPDKLRARLAHSVEPVKPSPDALVRIKAGARHRRRLQWGVGAGAGVVALAGAAAAVIALGSGGHPSASTRTVEPGFSPTAAALTPAPASALASPTASTTAPVSVSPDTSAQVTSVTGPSLPPVPHDVDGDGKADFASVKYAGTTAHVALRLADRTVSSAPFTMGKTSGSGTVSLVDVNADGRAKLLVTAIGATGTPYRLFQYVNSQLMQVPALTGAPTDPPLFSGGGGGGGGDFGCVAGHIEAASYVVEASTISGTPADRRYDVRASTLTLADGRLAESDVSTEQGLTMAQATTYVAQHAHGRCGASL